MYLIARITRDGLKRTCAPFKFIQPRNMTRAILQTNGSLQLKAIFFKLCSTRCPSHRHTVTPRFRITKLHDFLISVSWTHHANVSAQYQLQTALQCAVTVPKGGTSATLRPQQGVPWVDGMTVRCLLFYSSPDPSGLIQQGQDTCHSQSSHRFHYQYWREQNC